MRTIGLIGGMSRELGVAVAEDARASWIARSAMHSRRVAPRR